jgi:hypothetical protein
VNHVHVIGLCVWADALDRDYRIFSVRADEDNRKIDFVAYGEIENRNEIKRGMRLDVTGLVTYRSPKVEGQRWTMMLAARRVDILPD